MAMVDTALWFPRSPFWALGNNSGDMYMNAGNKRAAYRFQVPKTGTLDGIEYHILSWFGFNAPDNGLKVSFQDTDANGYPDGTPDQYWDTVVSAAGWQTGAALLTSDGTVSGSKRSVTKGDRLTVVFEFVSFVAGDVVNVDCLESSDNYNFAVTPAEVFPIWDSGGGWGSKLRLRGCNFTLKYSDGSYVPVGGYPHWPTIVILNSTTLSTASAPDERGGLFTMPFTGRVRGAWVMGRLDNGNSINIYDTDGTTAIATHSVTPAKSAWTGSVTMNYIMFPESPILNVGSTYRFAVKPTDLSGITLCESIFSTSALRQCVEPYAAVDSQLTTRTGAGAWSETDTQQFVFGLFLDQIDVSPGGGSGGEHSAVF